MAECRGCRFAEVSCRLGNDPKSCQGFEDLEEKELDEREQHYKEKYEDAVEALRIHKEAEGPNLGLATTRELLAELTARIEIDGNLDYKPYKG